MLENEYKLESTDIIDRNLELQNIGDDFIKIQQQYRNQIYESNREFEKKRSALLEEEKLIKAKAKSSNDWEAMMADLGL